MFSNFFGGVLKLLDERALESSVNLRKRILETGNTLNNFTRTVMILISKKVYAIEGAGHRNIIAISDASAIMLSILTKQLNSKTGFDE